MFWHRAWRAGLGCLGLLALAGVARARGLEGLGSLERGAVEDALGARGLVVEGAPEGKRVGALLVFNHEVFSRDDSYAQLLNVFHRTTREDVIRREVLLAPGDLYSEALAEESTRNLRDADFSSLVVILPVRAAAPGTVDLFVVTRDVWSLRFNTDFDFGEGTLRSLSTSLSENNLGGWRKKFSLAFNMGRGSYAVGPSYLDPNVAGTRLVFSFAFRTYYGRGDRSFADTLADAVPRVFTGTPEGESVSASLAYPLYSLASRWGASVSAAHSNRVLRSYLGNDLRFVDLRATPEDDGLPQIYRLRSQSVDSQVVRSFGRAVIQRVTFGHSLSVVRPQFLRGYPTEDPAQRAAFAAEVFPRSERVSALYLSYSLFTPRYRIYRDYGTYDLREDQRLGPSFSASVSNAAGWLGLDTDYVGLGASAAWTFDYLDGLQQVALGWGGRVRDGRLVDQSRSASVALATPVLRRLVRVVGGAETAVIIDNTRPDSYYTVGAEAGMRGYGTGEFLGQARWVAHLEARSTPLAVATFRLGMVAFYDVGHAAARFVDLGARQDAGVGIRLLIPQLNFYVLRVDWAVAFDNGGRTASGGYLTRAGFPGRISAGFRQVF